MAEFAQSRAKMQRYIVVDDDRLNNLVAKFIIQRHNKEAEIQLYTDPELALAGICELSCNPDDQCQTTILLDINMPMMNGWEFLEQFKHLKLNANKQFRIFMISSSIDPSDKKRAADHHLISGFFSKPLSVEHLKTATSHSGE